VKFEWERMKSCVEKKYYPNETKLRIKNGEEVDICTSIPVLILQLKIFLILLNTHIHV